jgi:hypothetical protein
MFSDFDDATRRMREMVEGPMAHWREFAQGTPGSYLGLSDQERMIRESVAPVWFEHDEALRLQREIALGIRPHIAHHGISGLVATATAPSIDAITRDALLVSRSNNEAELARRAQEMASIATDLQGRRFLAEAGVREAEHVALLSAGLSSEISYANAARNWLTGQPFSAEAHPFLRQLGSHQVEAVGSLFDAWRMQPGYSDAYQALAVGSDAFAAAQGATNAFATLFGDTRAIAIGTDFASSQEVRLKAYEPRRDCRRLQLLRDWSHDEASITEILT